MNKKTQSNDINTYINNNCKSKRANLKELINILLNMDQSVNMHEIREIAQAQGFIYCRLCKQWHLDGTVCSFNTEKHNKQVHILEDDIINFLNKKIKEKKFTKKYVAYQIGMNPNTFRTHLNRKTSLPFLDLIKISVILDFSLDEISEKVVEYYTN